MKQKILESLSFHVPIFLLAIVCGGIGGYIALSWWGVTGAHRVVLSLALPAILVITILLSEGIISEDRGGNCDLVFLFAGALAYAVYYFVYIGPDLWPLMLATLGNALGILVGGLIFSFLCMLFRAAGERWGRNS